MRAVRAPVVLACALVLWAAAIAQTPKAPARVTGSLEDSAITESSGVAASRRNPGIFWTHNDSGDGPDLFAFDRTGKSHGRWTVPGARNVDWEDIDIGPAPAGSWYLYVGDIGDNSRRRREIVVYRVEEPVIGGARECRAGCRTAAPAVFHLEYPDGPHNAEAMLVHPNSGDLYIVTKAWSSDRETGVYAVRAGNLQRGVRTLERIASLNVPERVMRGLMGGITGGAISPDGRRVALCDYLYIYEAVLPPGAAFDEIWKQNFVARTTGMRLQTEGIAYTPDGKALILTSEGKHTPVVEVRLDER